MYIITITINKNTAFASSSGHTGSAIGAMALPVGADFTLDKVPNFNKICVFSMISSLSS